MTSRPPVATATRPAHSAWGRWAGAGPRSSGGTLYGTIRERRRAPRRPRSHLRHASWASQPPGLREFVEEYHSFCLRALSGELPRDHPSATVSALLFCPEFSVGESRAPPTRLENDCLQRGHEGAQFPRRPRPCAWCWLSSRTANIAAPRPGGKLRRPIVNPRSSTKCCTVVEARHESIVLYKQGNRPELVPAGMNSRNRPVHPERLHAKQLDEGEARCWLLERPGPLSETGGAA